MKVHRTIPVLFAAGLIMFAVAADESPKQPKTGTLVVIDAAGKEQKLKAWKFTEGVRRLDWLAPAKAVPKDKREAAAPAGPEALILRAETGDGLYLEGTLTLIPLDRLRLIEYDNEENTVTVEVSSVADAAEKFIGTTKYKQVNKLVIEAEVDKGDLGIAEIKYLGGYPRGIRGVRFPAAKAAPPHPEGRRVLVVSSESKGKKTMHKVVDLMPLYRLSAGGEKLLPALMFKKTLKLDVGKIKKVVAADGGGGGWQVTLKDGGEETLTLLETMPFEDKPARLLGLVGRVPAGYKLFPVRAIAEITFDAEEK